MRGSRLIVLGAASHISRAHCEGLYSSRYQAASSRALVQSASVGRTLVRDQSSRPTSVLRSTCSKAPLGWLSSQKRRETLEPDVEALQSSEGLGCGGNSSGGGRMIRSITDAARRYVVIAKGCLRRLQNVLRLILDIATLRRLRRIRRSKQVGGGRSVHCLRNVTTFLEGSLLRIILKLQNEHMFLQWDTVP